MKLWFLQARDDLCDGDNPWCPWYDKTFRFVIRAGTEERARRIADENAGDENRSVFLGEKISGTEHPWLDEKYSICAELTAAGKEGIIVEDCAEA